MDYSAFDNPLNRFDMTIKLLAAINANPAYVKNTPGERAHMAYIQTCALLRVWGDVNHPHATLFQYNDNTSIKEGTWLRKLLDKFSISKGE